MRRMMVAGNWKMQGSRESVENLLTTIKQDADRHEGVEWVVFPPFVYLQQTQQLLSDSVISWGAQNLSEQEPGAFTGEVAASMLRDFACRYVLVGHSERRHVYGEDSALVAAKFAQAQRHGLLPILCLGETLAEREAGQTAAVVLSQLQAVLELEGGVSLLARAVLAYEPVWAIGTGVTASPDQAQEVHSLLREHLAKQDADIAEDLRILYGGSVKPDNAASLFAMQDIDGGLIGGASLDPHAFLEIGAQGTGSRG